MEVENPLVNRYISIVEAFLFFNTVLLLYLAWVKDTATCSVCGQLVTLSVSDVTIALVGALTSFILIVMVKASRHFKVIGVFALVLAISASCFSLYLQIFQFRWQSSFCYLCLTAATVFIIVMSLLFYTVIWLSNPSDVKIMREQNECQGDGRAMS